MDQGYTTAGELIIIFLNIANIYSEKLEKLLILLKLLLKHLAYSENIWMLQTVFKSSVVWFGGLFFGCLFSFFFLPEVQSNTYYLFYTFC